MRGWRFDLGVLLGGWALFVLLYPPPPFFWLDFSWVVYNLLPLPLTPAGMSEAIQWAATTQAPSRVRPVRAVEWWLAVKALGCGPLGYYVMNVLAGGLAVWAVTRVAVWLRASRTVGLLTGVCFAVSYASGYFILRFGFGLAAAAAFIALAGSFRAEDLEGIRRRCLMVGGVLLLLLAGLSHETFLALALVPLAHAAIVRRDRSAVLRALPLVAVLPIYAVARQLQAAVYGSAPSLVGGIVSAVAKSPGILMETPGRVFFTVLTGGLPLDPVRALPYFPEFARIRELILSPAGLLTLAAVAVPAGGLTALGLRAAWRSADGRRRLGFYLVWLGLGSVPLMLPVATPEVFHLTGALPALFLLWTEGLAFQPTRARAVTVAGGVLLVAWIGVHGAATWVLFHRDLPTMGGAVRALHRVLAQAQVEGHRANILFFPAQVGGHYGMMPTVTALYPAGPGAGSACLRGDQPQGCLVEPVWVWSALRPWPRLPAACRARDGIRVGPLSPAVVTLLEGSRRLLAQPTASLLKERDPRILGACPLAGIEPALDGAAPYLLYRAEVSPSTRWYRFSLESGPELIPLADCK